MRDAVIVGAVRTAVGRKGGKLSGIRPDDLASLVLKDLVARLKVDPAEIEDVILGCVDQLGEQGFNIARNAALIAGLPVEVCGTTLDRMCGSGQQAANFAAMGVMAGQYDVVIAGGIEHMTRVPMGSNAMGPGDGPLSPKLQERFNIVPQGISAEMIAEKWGLKREELDEFSAQSHEKAGRARALGLEPRARVVATALAGVDPTIMLTGPIPATQRVLRKAGMTLDQIDLVEINEAFASVVLAWEREYHPDMRRVNVNGGAIALGHPLGCSGAKLMTTLLHELERTGKRYGLQTMCIGFGQGIATIIERL